MAFEYKKLSGMELSMLDVLELNFIHSSIPNFYKLISAIEYDGYKNSKKFQMCIKFIYSKLGLMSRVVTKNSTSQKRQKK